MNRAAIKSTALWQMAKGSAVGWNDDYAPSIGAAIAYYTEFSIAPLLIMLIAILGFFLGRQAASGQIYAQLAGCAATPRDGVVRKYRGHRAAGLAGANHKRVSYAAMRVKCMSCAQEP
jgi:membrane protein